jgi:hypothetical protein
MRFPIAKNSVAKSQQSGGSQGRIEEWFAGCGKLSAESVAGLISKGWEYFLGCGVKATVVARVRDGESEIRIEEVHSRRSNRFKCTPIGTRRER